MSEPEKLAIDGREISYILSGSGEPVILLMNGHNTPLNNWGRLFPGLEKLGTILCYDRLGTGGSDKPDMPQDGEAIIRRLLALLNALELKAPYILVGHSLGGLYANLFARRYPDQTAGVVLVESGHPDEALFEREESGLLKKVIEKVINVFGSNFKSDPNSEYNSVAATVEQIKDAGDFPAIPLAVVTGTQRMPLVPKAHFEIHQQKQKELLSLSPKARHFEAANSGHLPQLSEPLLVLEAIRAIIEDGHKKG